MTTAAEAFQNLRARVRGYFREHVGSLRLQRRNAQDKRPGTL
jgi:hypothetical protein